MGSEIVSAGVVKKYSAQAGQTGTSIKVNVQSMGWGMGGCGCGWVVSSLETNEGTRGDIYRYIYDDDDDEMVRVEVMS